MKQMPDYTLIDQKATGARLKNAVRASGYRVNEIQQFLSLSCPQPIYRWFRGDALPSLHHLYALSALLDMPLDDLLVRGQACADAVQELKCPGSLRIDFEKTGNLRFAPGMYGVVLLSRFCMYRESSKIPASDAVIMI